MTNLKIFGFIQARMSSKRFPGKMLATFNGKPLIKHVWDITSQSVSINKTIVLTSTDKSDDPLCAYMDTNDITYFRGSLYDVFRRFQEAAKHYPSDYILRITGDSPIMNPLVINAMIMRLTPDMDVLTNTYPRSFPKGQSFALLKMEALMNAGNDITQFEQEHVLPYFINRPDIYNCMNMLTLENDWSDIDMSVDTEDNLKILESGAISCPQFDHTQFILKKAKA